MVENLEDVVKEYNEMLQSKEYITFRKFNKFIDKYQNIFKNHKNEEIEYIANQGYQEVEKHNNKIIEEKLIIYKPF